MRAKGRNRVTTQAASALCACLLAVLLLGAAPPSDPLVSQQPHLEVVHAFKAWDIRRGEGATVAVLDTGVDLAHPDLVDRLVTGVDLVERDTPPDDPQGHGTIVAGIIAAVAGNGRGVAGVAPRAKIMPIRVLDGEGRGTSDIVAEGIRWAIAAQVQVINLSLAEVTADEESPDETGLLDGVSLIQDQVVVDAIYDAYAAGILVVAAAGNDGRDRTPYDPDTPVLVVGATDQRGYVWEDSNHDDRTIFAPGVAILSTWNRQRYARSDGTSFATPIVSAGAAMLMGAGLTVDETVTRLIDTAIPVGPAPPEPTPAPTPTAETPTSPPPSTPPPVPPGAEVGLGRIDLGQAVQGVEPAPTPTPTVPPEPVTPPPPPPPTQAAAPDPDSPEQVAEPVMEVTEPPAAAVTAPPPSISAVPAPVTPAPTAVAALEPVQPVGDAGMTGPTIQPTQAPGTITVGGAGRTRREARQSATTVATMLLGADVLLAGWVLGRKRG